MQSSPSIASARKPRHLSRTFWRIVGYGLLLLCAAIIGIPLYWMISGALKTLQEIRTFPPVWIPESLQWENFTDAWSAAPFDRFYLNSVVTTLLGSGFELFFSITSAYALAFLKFPRKNLVFILLLVALMVPAQVTILPNYVTMARMDWVNTYQGIFLPGVPVAFGTFLLRQYFLGLPRDILDAARVDGATHFRLLWSVVVPVSIPAIVTFGLISLVAKWNEFLWPLVITNTLQMRTLPIGITYLLDSEGNTEWGAVMAGTIFVILPILVIFVFAQRYIVSGMTAGATKG